MLTAFFDGNRLITIYDCKVELKWTGTAADGTTAEGKLTIPEVSHEITLDGLSDYVVSHLLPIVCRTPELTISKRLGGIIRVRM